MNGLLRVAAHGLWYLSSLPSSLAFQLARRGVAGAQRKLLLRLLRRNAETEFGRRYDFTTLRSVAEYQTRVPLSTYDDYQVAIQQISAGQPHVLTQEPVRLLEPTSGSTAASKLIPYTASLRAEFQRAIAPWIVDLYSHEPRLLFGQAYWSVTPVTRRHERSPGGIPIGFEEDSEYFGRFQRRLIQSVLAVPPMVKLIEDVEAFRYVTLLFLLRRRSLALISVWNPTFLIMLVERLSDWWPLLADDIARGTISAPAPMASDLQLQLSAMNQPHRQRAAEIRAAFQSGHDRGAIHTQLWPHLRLISCWADAPAALHIPEAARLFPHARIRGKGLISTEGFVSFPMMGYDGSVLAIRSHFFEFLPTDGGPVKLAHELEKGDCYSVVITTGGGLYRYQLQDLVQVVGHIGECPLIRFLGKEDHVSDWFGEKLNERHVRQALDVLLARHALRPTFAMLACEEDAGRHGYTLFIEAKDDSDDVLRRLGTELEAALQENYHYRYCRDLGQLSALRVFRIAGGALETYLSVCQQHGQRAGDIKPVALHQRGGWSYAFRGTRL